MTIQSYTISPNQVVPGQQVTVEMTIVIEENDVNNGFMVYGGNASHFIVYRNDNLGLVIGTNNISFTAPISSSYADVNMGSNSSIVDPKWAVILGPFGARCDISNPITYINSYQPTISSFILKRGRIKTNSTGEYVYNSNGSYSLVEDDEGSHVILTLALSVTGTPSLSNLSLTLYWKQDATPTTTNYSGKKVFTDDEIYTFLYGGVENNSSIFTDTFVNTNSWNFMLVFSDQSTKNVAYFSIPRYFANMHLSGLKRGGVCFGGFCNTDEDAEPRLESHFPIYAYGGIAKVTNITDSLAAFGIQHGTTSAQTCVASSSDAEKGSVSYSVTFNKKYLDIPTVLATVNSANITSISDGDYARLYYAVSCISQTGFMVTVRNIHSGDNVNNISINWIAFGNVDETSNSVVTLKMPPYAMSSANSQDCTVGASSTYNSSTYPAYKAFDYKLTTGWASENETAISESKPQYIYIRMSQALVNIKVYVYARATKYIHNPTAGIIQGSNNGSTWYDLKAFSGWNGDANGSLLGVVDCQNETAYQYIRVYITEASGNEKYVAIGYIQIEGEAHTV